MSRLSSGLAACAALLAFLLTSCAGPRPLPVMGSVPEFHLTAHTGQPFDSKALAGRVWVADFIFTTCTGPCPMMTAQMRRVQTATADIPDVKLVSFTVDPSHDTPPVLTEYAGQFKADPNRWVFLTGEPAPLNDLGLRAFHLNAVDGSLVHSTRFALVDRRGRIRAYYSSDEDGFMKNLLAGIRELEREKS
jgi:protein SCO1